jgi:hypothetical protein
MNVIRLLPTVVWFIALGVNAACIGIFIAVQDYPMVLWHVVMGALCYLGYVHAVRRKRESKQ